MKNRILFILVGLQFVLTINAHAWTPLNPDRSDAGVAGLCQQVVAADKEDKGKQQQKADEEQEPDCD